MGRDTWPQRCRQPTPALKASHSSSPILVDLQATMADLPTDLSTSSDATVQPRQPASATAGASRRVTSGRAAAERLEPAVETGTCPLRVVTVCRQSNVDPGTVHGQGMTK